MNVRFLQLASWVNAKNNKAGIIKTLHQLLKPYY
jgi:hypothetical protein